MLRKRWVLPMFELGRDQIGGRGTAAAGDRGEHFLRGRDAFTALGQLIRETGALQD